MTVCACTYKRSEGLKALLSAVEKQVFSTLPPPKWDIVIADNEGSANARRICEAFQETSTIPLTYVHEPRRGISYARNACLDHVAEESDFFVFIDDDEIPDPDWLEKLICAQLATDADVVWGAVFPDYDPSAPSWIREGGFFGSHPRRPGKEKQAPADLQEIGGAATNNVLVRCSVVRESNLRFDPGRGLTGGEDKLFFRTLKHAGSRIVFAANARVCEKIPEERATLRYLMRLEYRLGNLTLRNKIQTTRANAGRLEITRLRLRTFGRGVGALGSGAFEVVREVLRSLLSMQSRKAGIAMGILHMARGCGVSMGAMGLRDEHYR
jgi:glycosyltransferase involved in cell wall biosynthesis